jgi:hypothetical protein
MFIENYEYEILTIDGYKDFKGIYFSENTTLKLYTQTYELECTYDHEIYINEHTKVKSIDLNIGDDIQTINGLEKIIYIEYDLYSEVCDIISVEDTNAFYANNIYVSNCILLDEFAFVPNAMADEFFTSVYPTISSGTDSKIFVASTPNGMNHFYKLFKDGEDGRNGFATMHVSWERHPHRDAKWEEDQRKILGDLKFSQEMEADFQGSSNTLLNSTCIKNLVYKTPVLINDCLKIYQPPIEGNLYVMTVDVSRGQSLDYSAFKIFDITDSPYRVVANYNSNEIPPILYPNVIHKVAKDYNECYVLIELNDIGSQVIDILHTDLEYENVLYSTDGMITEWGKMGKAGLRTTQRSKRIGCSALKSLMENHKLIDNDFDTIVQLSTFIATKTSFEADSGCHDDLVMCLVLFAYLSTQQFFKDVTNVNIRNMIYENQMTRIENELTPYGYIDNGIDTIEPDLDIVGKEVWIPANQSYSDFIKDYWN